MGCDEDTEMGETFATTDETNTVPDTAQTLAFTNSGDGEREGHTPRGFMGQGAGLFTGDNLNDSFPDGEGVQIFMSLDIGKSLDGTQFARNGGSWSVDTAWLGSDEASVAGDPFATLGVVMAEQVVFDEFSSALWDLEPTGDFSCTFATSLDDIGCDVTPLIQSAVDNGDRFAQLRIRFEIAGDNDGSVDLLQFFTSNSNATEEGLFDLTVEATQTAAP